MRAWIVWLSVCASLIACRTPGPEVSEVKDGEDVELPLMWDLKDGALVEPCPAPGCWTNYMRMTDIDADGDLDVVAVNYADFFGGGIKKQPLQIWLNDGQAAFTSANALVSDLKIELRQIAIADVNGDGKNDLYAPNANGKNADAFFVSQAAGGFANEVVARVGERKSTAGAVRFVDVDSDGDLDLFIAKGYAKGQIGANIGDILVNDGSGKFTALENGITGTATGNDIDDVDVADVDNDFDPDLVVNPHNGGNIFVLKNDGTGHFAVDASAVAAAPSGGNHYDPAVCDFDGDGYLDVFIDNIGGGYNELLLINDKTGKFVDSTTNVTGNDDGQDDNGVVCADVDNDGDYDAVVISLFADGERLFLNDGAGHLAYRKGAFKMFGDGTLWAEFGDLNGDKRLDFVTVQGESGDMTDRVYLANANVPVDDQAPTFRAIETVAAGRRVRFAVQDRAIGDEGPQLEKAFAKATTADGEVEVRATFMGGDLFRVVLPDGTTSFLLCARDVFGNQGCSEMQSLPTG